MKKINLTTKNMEYTINISNSFNDFTIDIPNKLYKCLIVTDDVVAQYYLDELINHIEKFFSSIDYLVIPQGESSKSKDMLIYIYEVLIDKEFTRRDYIISLGGGVIGDLTGFVAATYMRGISWIQVPTSLLAQNDSSIGGKTAINLKQVKNIVGVFYQPKQVYINYSVLNTLPLLEIKNGMVEILVHSLIKDEELFHYLEENINLIFALNKVCIEEIIYRNCLIKAKVVEKDEYDKGERILLNFGHTIGHAIESACEYSLKHGECVALGMIGACFISMKKEFISYKKFIRIIRLINEIKIMKSIERISQNRILEYIMHDKKNVDGKIVMVLLNDIGSAFRFEGIDKNVLVETVDYIQNLEIIDGVVINI